MCEMEGLHIPVGFNQKEILDTRDIKKKKKKISLPHHPKKEKKKLFNALCRLGMIERWALSLCGATEEVAEFYVEFVGMI